MERKPKTIYLDEDVFEHLQSCTLNIHDWVNERYRDEVIDIDYDKKRLKELEKERKQLLSNIKVKEKRFEALDKKLKVYQDWYARGGRYIISKQGIYRGLDAFNSVHSDNKTMAEFRTIVRTLERKQ